MHHVTASDSASIQDRTLENHGISSKTAQPPQSSKRDSKKYTYYGQDSKPKRDNSVMRLCKKTMPLADTLVSDSSEFVVVYTPRSMHQEPSGAPDVDLNSPQFEKGKDPQTDSPDLLGEVVESTRFHQMVKGYSEPPKGIELRQLKKAEGSQIHAKTTAEALLEEAVLSPRRVKGNVEKRRESKGKEKSHESGSTGKNAPNWLDDSSLNGRYHRLQNDFRGMPQESDDQRKSSSGKGSGRSGRLRRFTKKEDKGTGKSERWFFGGCLLKLSRMLQNILKKENAKRVILMREIMKVIAKYRLNLDHKQVKEGVLFHFLLSLRSLIKTNLQNCQIALSRINAMLKPESF